ncbi:nucleotidyltransferase family protein [Hymenobacter baengnokdamensis]|uniref:nucleotidyltransferase family protein n=1 Tax=Hymenobacter baengnokdamensis TaxID=2615203 RepID=UPI001E33E379|nr:nucleotidyltransferase domain-containing protein [Hymenobacter baengnokdamensis]
MYLTEQELNIIRAYFRTKPVLKAWLFGSYARGEADETSDVDLLVNVDNSISIGWDFFIWHEDLAELLRKKVDVIAPSKRSSRFKQEIEPDLQLVYERAA